MFEEIKGKEVLIQMGSASVVTDRQKGTVMEISESWMKIQRKSKLIYINLKMIGSITVSD